MGIQTASGRPSRPGPARSHPAAKFSRRTVSFTNASSNRPISLRSAEVNLGEAAALDAVTPARRATRTQAASTRTTSRDDTSAQKGAGLVGGGLQNVQRVPPNEGRGSHPGGADTAVMCRKATFLG